MIITFITPTLKLTGGNLVLFKYAEGLSRLGHKVYIIAPDKEEKTYSQNGIEIKTFKKNKSKILEAATFYLIYLTKFADLIPQSDIIIPVFFPLSIHSIFCKHINKCRNIVSLFQDFKEMIWYGNYIFFLLKLKFIQDNIDLFICVSDPITEIVRKTVKKQVYTVKDAIEHEYFYDRKLVKENYLLFVGTSPNAKGLKNFLKTFSHCKKKHPNLKAKVITPTKLKIKATGIEFIEYDNNRSNLAEIFSKALVYVSQSIGDSFGLAPLEAMASSTCTVLTDTAGSKEYAENNYNCLKVPERTPQKTAEAILKLIENPELRKKLEQNGTHTAKKYRWESSISKFNSIISENFAG